MVSICCITYNHEKFIAQALDSFLMQQTNFDFEIVLGEDCSTDNTRSICKQYQQKYPDKIKLLLPETNVGMMGNFINTLNSCNAKYVALCDGDDYWTDTQKLQKQVDFLEANTDYSICFHRVLELHPNQEILPEKLNTKATITTYSLHDLAFKNFIRTPSVVYRNHLFKAMPAWLSNSPVGDYVVHLLNASNGKILYLPDTMAVYRKHPTSNWSSGNQITLLQKWFSLLDILLAEFSNDEATILALQKQYIFTYNTFLKQSLAAGESDIFLEKTKHLIKTHSFFLDYWFDNLYKEQLKVLQVHPKGVKKSTKFLASQIKNYLIKSAVKKVAG